MKNVIVIFILILIGIFALAHTIKHFRGESGCCGGSMYKPAKKKLKNVIYKKVYIVEGMHCEHCKAQVEEKINDIHGLSGRVDLRHGKLTVKFAENIPDEIIKSAIEKAGYKLL